MPRAFTVVRECIGLWKKKLKSYPAFSKIHAVVDCDSAIEEL